MNYELTVEWVESAQKISEALWQEYFPAHLEGRFWYLALEKAGLDDQFRFFYALVKRNHEIVAIAPAFLMDVPIELVAPEAVARVLRLIVPLLPSLGYQRTLFVGSPCADECTIGLRKDVELSDLVFSLQTALEKKAAVLKAPMIVWKDLPDSYKNAMSLLCEHKDMFRMVSFPGTVVELSSSSIEDYYKNLKGSRRHNLKKKLKRSKELISLSASVIQNPDQNTLTEIFALFWQTYEKGKTKFEKLNKEFFEIIAGDEKSWFVLVRETSSQQLVAFMLCFRLGDQVINKFIGIDYQRPAQWYLYFRLWEFALQWVLTQHCRRFQSGQTGYRAKIDVGHRLTELTNSCKHRNPVINAVYARLAKTVSWSTLDSDLDTYLQAHPQLDETPAEKLIVV